MDDLSQLKDGILKCLELEHREGALAVPYCNILGWLKANGYSADCFVNRLQVVRALDELARAKRIVRPNRGRSAWRLAPHIHVHDFVLQADDSRLCACGERRGL